VSIGATSIGGVLLVPALMFWAGLEVHQAAATVLLSGLFTASLAAWLYTRRGSLDWRLVWPLVAGGVPGAYLGALTAAQLPARTLAAAIGVLIVVASALVLRPPRPIADKASRGVQAERILLAAIGALAGFGAGLSGAGGPIFSVPLMLLGGFAPLASIGAAMGFTIAATVSGSVANALAGTIHYPALALVAACQVAGVASGVRIAHALPVATLRQAAVWLCIAAGAAMIVRASG
jgi:uncharacterized membrane protein YfcA